MPSSTFWGMQHLNSNILAAVTTTMTAVNGEVIETCVLPLDLMLKPHDEILLFNMKAKPEGEIDWDYCDMTKKHLADTIMNGFDQGKVADFLMEWFVSLDTNKRKKIIPLTYDYLATRQGLINWLGYEDYSTIFSEDYRDVLVATHFLNDRECCRGEAVPYAKQNLRWLAKKLNVEQIDVGGSCITNAYTLAQVYRRLLVS